MTSQAASRSLIGRQTHMHTHTYTYTHMHTNTYTHTYMHTYTDEPKQQHIKQLVMMVWLIYIYICVCLCKYIYSTIRYIYCIHIYTIRGVRIYCRTIYRNAKKIQYICIVELEQVNLLAHTYTHTHAHTYTHTHAHTYTHWNTHTRQLFSANQ